MIERYTYPPHFVYPKDHVLYITHHAKKWLDFMPDLLTKPNVTLEVGALFGGTTPFIMDLYCKLPGSHHYIVDINTNDYLETNIKPYDNITFNLGESADVLRNLSHQGKTKEFLDMAYIDGNHLAKFVLEDAVNCFHLVKMGGYMVFDDYTWGEDQEYHQRPKTAVDAFIAVYKGHVEVVDVGFQVILKKTEYQFNKVEKSGNYYIDWPFTTKTALKQ